MIVVVVPFRFYFSGNDNTYSVEIFVGKSSLDKTVLCDILTGSTSVDSGSATINGSSVTRRRVIFRRALNLKI